MITNVAGLDLNFQVFGSGVPLVVLHGWGDNSNNWVNFAKAVEKNFQVFLIDLPGCGDSAKPNGVWDLEDYTNCILTLLKDLEINKPILLGHSHGGKIVAQIAAISNVSGLILVSASGVDKPSIKVRTKVYFYKTIKFIFSKLGNFGKKIIDYFSNKLGSRDYREAGSLRATMVKVVGRKIFDILPKIKTPTLIIWGDQDKTLNVEQSKIFRFLISNSYIRICWNADHHPHLTHVADLAKFTVDHYRRNIKHA